MTESVVDSASTPPGPPPNATRPRHGKAHLLRIVGGLTGLTLTGWTLWSTGPAELVRTARPALAVIPLCLACELAKIACETFATRHALGPWAKKVPFGKLYRIHLITYGVGQVFPMPRPAAEATKAALLAPHGVPYTASTSSGTTLQSATFLAMALLSAVSAVFVVDAPGLPLRALLVVNALALGLLGVGARALVRSEGAMRALGRRFPRLAAPLLEVREEASRGPLVSPWPSLLLTVGNLFNVLELAIAAHAMSALPSPFAAFAAFGAQLVSGTVAVFVPGQVGAREAAFALASGALGTTEVRAAAISAFTHLVQLGIALIGFLLLFSLRRPRDSSDSSDSSDQALSREEPRTEAARPRS